VIPLAKSRVLLAVAGLLPAIASGAVSCGGDRPSYASLQPDDDGGIPPGSGGRRAIDEDAARPHDAGRVLPDVVDAGPQAADSGVKTPDAEAGPQDAGCAPETDVAPPADAGAALCPVGASWEDGTDVATASTAGKDVFGSITPDELTIAWISVDAGVPTLHYADRASANDPFFPASSIAGAQGHFALDRPALSPDGLRIVVVREDGKAFGEYTRTARLTTFSDVPAELTFAALNTQGLLFTAEESFGDPVLSEDDRTLYYSRHDATSHQTIFATTRTSNTPWSVGSPVETPALERHCGHRKRPTGVSSDQLTLFFWDEESGTERATYRPSLDAPFEGAVVLGARFGAQPNKDCTRLYYSGKAADAADDDVLVADR
jgi:hypothetical protein